MAANGIGSRMLAWGVVDAAAVAVRIRDQRGTEAMGPVVGPELGGLSVFAIELALDARPIAFDSIGRDGSVIESTIAVPTATDAHDIGDRIDVRVVHRDAGSAFGTIIGEGSVDDGTWEYSVNLFEGEVDDHFTYRSPTGGGGGRGGGAAPRPGPGRRLRLKGSGASGDMWHLTGWADPVIDRVDVRLRSGEVLSVPVMGRELDASVVMFAIGLPDDARVAILDGYDADGAFVERTHVAGQLTWLERSLGESSELRHRAELPVPDAVERLWETVVGAGEDNVELLVPVDELATRWPIRPLLLAPAEREQRWAIVGGRHRFPISQVVSLALRCDLGSGLVLQQGVAWVEPGGQQDDPNTTVRGVPARLEELTLAVNNIDEVGLTWSEALGTDVEPFRGLYLSIRADPHHHGAADVVRLAEELRVAEG